MELSSPRPLYSLRSTLPQLLHRRVTVDQLTTLRLRIACGNVSSYLLAFRKHPVFEIKLFPDDFKSLIEDFIRVSIRPRPDSQFNHTLVLGFQVNGHNSSVRSFLPAAIALIVAIYCA